MMTTKCESTMMNMIIIATNDATIVNDYAKQTYNTTEGVMAINKNVIYHIQQNKTYVQIEFKKSYGSTGEFFCFKHTKN